MADDGPDPTRGPTPGSDAPSTPPGAPPGPPGHLQTGPGGPPVPPTPGSTTPGSTTPGSTTPGSTTPGSTTPGSTAASSGAASPPPSTPGRGAAASPPPPAPRRPSPVGSVSASAGQASSTSRDWPAEAADTVVRVVDSVNAKTTANVLLVAKGIVYGLLAAILGVALAVWFLVLIFRLIDNYLPVDDDSSWDTWLLFGILSTIAGAVLWRMRGRLRPS